MKGKAYMNVLMLEQLLEKAVEFSYSNRLIYIHVRKYRESDVYRQLDNLFKSLETKKSIITTDITNLLKSHDLECNPTLLESNLLVIYVDDVCLLTNLDIIDILKTRTNREVGTILITQQVLPSEINCENELYSQAILFEM